MDILPILSTLKRHKTAAGLIVLQIALTCAIVCNALFLISERIVHIQQPSGLSEEHLVTMSLSSMVRVDNPDPQTRADVAALRQLPGVSAVSLTNQYPFGRNANHSGVRLTANDNDPSALVAAHYNVGPDFLKTMGLRLIAGRDFTAVEYVSGPSLDSNPNPRVTSVILTRVTAEQLFPGESALGKAVYIFGSEPQRVVGVLDVLPNPNPGLKYDGAQYAVITPVQPSYRSGNFVIRVDDPAQRDTVMKAAVDKLMQNSPGVKRVMRDQDTLSNQRSSYYRQDRSMVQLLAGVCVGLLVVTAFGIVGLASFWVQQRTRMIGTRRALGATQGQILRYFQTENLLLTSVGIVLGMAGAYGISLMLMQQYEMPRLPALYLPVGAVVLWALGQIAVFWPARRAAALPPVAALRGG